MLQYITSKDRDEVFAASLIRLIPASADSNTSQMLLKAADDPSPLSPGRGHRILRDKPVKGEFAG